LHLIGASQKHIIKNNFFFKSRMADQVMKKIAATITDLGGVGVGVEVNF
jgi:hypothetical protein